MLGLGFSINVLTMFGMVLAIGILVDDAIIVVENVERLMAEEGLSPHDATVKAMRQISGAIVGITVVLVSVFVPMAFFSGAVGNIYRQFAVTLAVSIGFSAFLALSLTPALCATLLRPIDADHHEKRGFFGWFQPRLPAPDRTLPQRGGRHPRPADPLDAGLRPGHRRGRPALRAPAAGVPAGRGPGRLHDHGDAARRHADGGDHGQRRRRRALPGGARTGGLRLCRSAASACTATAPARR